MLRRGRGFLRTRLPSSDIHEARARRGGRREERVRKHHGTGGGDGERARGSRATLLLRAGPPSRRRTHSVGGLGKEENYQRGIFCFRATPPSQQPHCMGKSVRREEDSVHLGLPTTEVHSAPRWHVHDT